MEDLKMLIGGTWMTGSSTMDVLNPFTEEPEFRVPAAGREDVAAAIDAATQAFKTWGESPAHERARLLYRTSELLEQRKDEMARTIALEAGKPLRDARGEVARAIQTFRFAAEE